MRSCRTPCHLRHSWHLNRSSILTLSWTNTYISLSYASNLVEGRSWSFARNLIPSYGTTSPAWTGMLALALSIGPPGVSALALARTYSLLFGIVAVLIVSRLARPFDWTGLPALTDPRYV